MTFNKRYKSLIAISIVFALFSCRDSDTKISKHIKKALEYQQEKDYSKAIDELNRAQESDGNSADLYILRGKVNSQAEKYVEALNDFSQAIAIDPKNTVAYFDQGVTYYLADKNDSAIRAFNNAIKTKGGDSLYLEFNGKLFKDKYIEADIPMPQIKYFRGLAFYSKSDNENAFNDFSFCFANKYNLKEVNLYLGVILLSSGSTKRGCDHLLTAVQLGNENAQTYINKYCK